MGVSVGPRTCYWGFWPDWSLGNRAPQKYHISYLQLSSIILTRASQTEGMVPNGVCFYGSFSMGVLQRWDLKNHIMDKSSDATPAMNTYTYMLNITYKIGQDFGTTDSLDSYDFSST